MPNTLKSTGYFCIASGGLGHLQMQKLSTFLLIVTEHFAECIHLHEFFPGNWFCGLIMCGIFLPEHL